MSHQGLSHTTSGAMEEVNHTLGETAFIGDLKDPGDGHGAEASRLDDGRVPCCNGPYKIEGNHGREIKGRKNDERSQGLPDVHRVHTGPDVLCVRTFHQLR